MAKRKTTPPPPAEDGIPAPPSWLRRSCRAAFFAHCRKLRDDGCTLHHVDANHVARLVHTEEDLQVAESEAARVPMTVESRANGAVVHAAHKRVSELRSEVRSWLRQLPRPATTTRTSQATPTASTTAPTPAASTATAGPPRLELIERIRARIAALQQQQQPGNPTGTTTPAAS